MSVLSFVDYLSHVFVICLMNVFQCIRAQLLIMFCVCLFMLMHLCLAFCACLLVIFDVCVCSLARTFFVITYLCNLT